MVAKTVAEVRNFLGWIPRRKKITITAMSKAAFLHLHSENDSSKHFYVLHYIRIYYNYSFMPYVITDTMVTS